MPFKDSTEVVSTTLSIPVAGKLYTVPSPPAEVGLRIAAETARGVKERRRAEAAARRGEEYVPDEQVLDDDDERDLYVTLLGQPLVDELHADGVNWPTLRLLGQTAYVWVAQGPDAAEAFWNAGGASAPKEERKAPQDRKPRKAAGSATSRG